MGFKDRIAHAWNAFIDNERSENHFRSYSNYGPSYSRRPDRFRSTISGEKSIISSIYTRLGIDVAANLIRHIREDENERFLEVIKSGLNECLNVEANLDQAATAFKQDMAMTLFDKGVIAVVPIETNISPIHYGGFDIKSLRVGEVVTWYPDHVLVSVYNQKKGKKEEIRLPKKVVAIIENPLYSVMNEPNSTLQRIIRKLNFLDAVDEAASSGKLDIIIQLPYTIRSETRKAQAEKRREELEAQLAGSKYGIGYTDGTERITQLNRPAENNMLKQIEFLMNQLYGQLGLAESIFAGTADEATMLNYHNRTIEPILKAITEGLTRTFLTKTARSQGQIVKSIRDPFKYMTASQLAEIADKFTRNEILSSNEIRSIMGFKPSNDPNADKLLNKNLPNTGELPAEINPPIELKQISP